MLIVLPATTVMKHPRRLGRPHCFLLNCCIVLFLPALGLAQTASLRGQVVDQSGAVIPRATVSLTGPSRLARTTTTAENGFYSFQALPAGQYIVRAAAPKLSRAGLSISVLQHYRDQHVVLWAAAPHPSATSGFTGGITSSGSRPRQMCATAMTISIRWTSSTHGDETKQIADDAADTYVITNNHHIGKAVANAADIAAILQGLRLR
jgi:hypothetical protein